MSSKSKALLAVIAAGAWCVAPIAHSQTDDTSPPTSPSQGMDQTMPPTQTTPGDATGATGAPPPGMGAEGTSPTAAIDQSTIEQFADAYIEVQTIQQQANTELEGAADPAQADEVRTSAQSDMIAAVERTGLQIEEFNNIVASMATDEQLRSRVSAEVQKRAGAASPSGGS